MLMLYCPQGNIASNVASQDITSTLNFEILPDKCIKSSERNGTEQKKHEHKEAKTKTCTKKEKKKQWHTENGGRQRRRRANSSGGRPCGQLIQGGRP